MSKSDPSLKLKISRDGAIPSFVLELQSDGTSTKEEDDSETVESNADGAIRSHL